jgi:ubiquinone/menaquinone biosynthesis C-methylase UbiE
MNKNYNKKFIERSVVERYESIEYNPDSYYAMIWDLEKEYLLSEIKRLDKSNINYLDFACGTGRVISFLENYVESSIGIDVSEEMLNLAKSKTKRSTLLKQDILECPLTEKYNLITAFRFFLNAEEQLREAALTELRKCMKKDAMLIISIHGNKRSFRYIVYIINLLLGKKLNQLSYRDVESLLSRNGFRIDNYTGIGVMPKYLYRFKLIRGFVHSFDRILYKNSYLKRYSHTMLFSVKLR